MPGSQLQSPEDERLLRRVLAAADIAEPDHKKFRQKADHFYSLWRNTQDFRRSMRDSSSPRGKDAVFRDGQKAFGPEMFIPKCFTIVETVMPRMLAGRPQMIVKPRLPSSAPNAENMRYMVEAQQEQMKYELKLQTVAKDGLMYGLGVQKTYWKQDWANRRQLVPAQSPANPSPYAIQDQGMQLIYDDPDAVAIDPRDFIPDPFCENIEDAEFAIHRTWRSTEYVVKMAQAQVWRNLDEVLSIDGLLDNRKYDEIWQSRRKAAGLDPSSSQSAGRSKINKHEVLEFHDGDQVITVLDRELVVQSGPNPHWHHQMPFQCYRPTEVTHELYGVGEIEPIERLQEELNLLRTQRRYNADLVLQRVFAYADGMIEEKDLQFGPGYAIPTNGDPRELLFPIPVGDIPHSGYEEEDRLNSDFDSTSGISDTVAGTAPAGGTTATAVQLTQQAASARIQNKTTRVELEIIDPGASQVVALNQQKILGTRQIRIDTKPLPGRPTPGEADSRWAWKEIGPEGLMGEFEITCASGSTQPENVPQDRADAGQMFQIFGQHPGIDQEALVKTLLLKMGIKEPEAMLAPPTPKVPAEVLDAIQQKILPILVQGGMPPEQATQIVGQLIAQSLAETGGPDLTTPDMPGEAPQANGNSGPQPQQPVEA